MIEVLAIKEKELLIIKVDSKVEVCESYTDTDVMLDFSESIDYAMDFDPEEDDLVSLFKTTDKEYILSGIEKLKSFMTEDEYKELLDSHQKRDLSGAKLLKKFK